MRIGAFQFRAKGSVEENLAALSRGVSAAAHQGVRLLLTQECALTGYPPVELPDLAQLRRDALLAGIEEIQRQAVRHDMYVVLGTVYPDADGLRNSLLLLGPEHDVVQRYDKRALWGWDRENYLPGTTDGVCVVDGVRVGLRICYEIRFPEYFRELLAAQVDVACVSFCDVSRDRVPARYDIIRAHLVTRAVENAMHIVSANSASFHQTAPTCIVDPDGIVLDCAPPGEESLLSFDFRREAPSFGRRGRIEHSRALIGQATR